MTGSQNQHRQPCPGRIFEDLGVGFSIGCFGGSIWYFLKGKLESTFDFVKANIHFCIEQVLGMPLEERESWVG